MPGNFVERMGGINMIKSNKNKKVEMCFCQSYYNKNNELQNCTCGRCQNDIKVTEKKIEQKVWIIFVLWISSNLIGYLIYWPLMIVVNLIWLYYFVIFLANEF